MLQRYVNHSCAVIIPIYPHTYSVVEALKRLDSQMAMLTRTVFKGLILSRHFKICEDNFDMMVVMISMMMSL